MSHPYTTTQCPPSHTEATTPLGTSHSLSTTQGNPERSLPTYAVVERICAIPGVWSARVMHGGRVWATAVIDPDVFGGLCAVSHSGASPEDAMLKVEQAVRDAYMAVS